MKTTNRLYVGDADQQPSADLRIGPFRLVEQIARGAMGQIWRGTHCDQNAEVAVKVVLSENATEPRFQRAFRQEARHMAELYHPCVVDVLDYGQLDEAAERSSSYHFRAGSPYLVMGFATHGSLATRLEGPTPWPVVRLVLTSLLDALAHSHARGVLHRDIKPGNVLLTSSDSTPRIQLSDFGLAYALRTSQEVAEWHRAAGTPEYMSPEQLTGRWRQYGPSTDLYGLGCLAWEMLTGAPPYRGDNAVQTADAHLRDPLPELSAEREVPPRLEKWLHALLAKKPEDRFQSAADAMWALAQLTDLREPIELPAPWNKLLDSSDDQDTERTEPTTCPASLTHALAPIVSTSDDRCEPDASRWRGNSQITRRLPEQWQPGTDPTTSTRLLETGSGIFQFRRLPLVGRDDERQLLWDRLGTSANDGRLGVTLVTGPVGIGKDRLSEWLCERASELGVVDVFRVSHRETDEFSDGLRRMLERKFQLEGLSRLEIEDFFKELLQQLGAEDRYEWRALTELLRPTQQPDVDSRVHFTSPKQRYLALVRLFERLTRRQPVLLRISDAHLATEILKFIETLVDEPIDDLPIHVIATIRPDELPDQPDDNPLDRIRQSPRTETLELAPLDKSNTHRLLEHGLFLESSTAYQVIEKSGGNPRYAIETVDAWIDRGLLESTRSGYRLREDASPRPPDESIDLWSDVLNRLIEDDNQRRLLELAAGLGRDFRRQTWRRAAEFAGLTWRPDSATPFLDRHYLREQRGRLTFTQNQLRDALVDSAKQADRWPHFCRCCARALDDAPSSPQTDRRVAYLRAEAGDGLTAVRRYLQAARQFRKQRDYPPMLHLAQRGLATLQELPSSSELRLLEVKLLDLTSHGLHGLSANEQALEEAERGLALAERLGSSPWIGVLEGRRVGPLNLTGELEEALRAGRRSVELLEEHGSQFGTSIVSVLTIMANIHRRRGNYDTAIAQIDRASRFLKFIDDPTPGVQLETARIRIRIQRREPIPPREIEILYERCNEHQIQLGQCILANLRAEVARQNDELVVARDWYQTAIDKAQLINNEWSVIPRINLAMIALQRDRPQAAGHRAEKVLQDLRRRTRPRLNLYAMAAKLPMLAERADLEELDAILDRVEASMRSLEIGSDDDLTVCFETALDELSDGPEGDRLRSRLRDLATLDEPLSSREVVDDH